MTQALCCPKVEDKYKPACLARTCPDCAATKLELHESEKQFCGHITGKLRCYKYVSVGLVEGKDGTVRNQKKLEYREEDKTGQELVDHLNNKLTDYPACHLSDFPEHQFRANFNQDAHDETLADLINQPVGTHYLNLDWAERMSLLVQDEAMTLHWNQKAVGILVGVHIRHAHTSDDGVGHTPEEPRLWKRHVFFITDVMDQGHQTVTAARRMLWEHDKARGLTVLNWEEWSDGCCEQFRCAGALMDLAESVKRGTQIWSKQSTNHLLTFR